MQWRRGVPPEWLKDIAYWTYERAGRREDAIHVPSAYATLQEI